MLIHYPSKRTYHKVVAYLHRIPQVYFTVKGKHYLELTDNEYDNLMNDEMKVRLSKLIKKAEPKDEIFKVCETIIVGAIE
jgi:hypothetical protein